MDTNYTHTTTPTSFNRFNILHFINKKIEKEKENAIGISIALVMIGTGIASITAALSVYEHINIFILMTATILAMSTNVAAISQQPFKTIVWMFIVNVVLNTFLLFYQIIDLVA